MIIKGAERKERGRGEEREKERERGRGRITLPQIHNILNSPHTHVHVCTCA